MSTPIYDPTYVPWARFTSGIKPTTLTVTSSPTLLPSSSRLGRTSIQIQNQGSNPIFIGDITVSTSNGYQLNPFSDISYACTDTSQFYAVAVSSTQVWVGEGL